MFKKCKIYPNVLLAVGGMVLAVLALEVVYRITIFFQFKSSPLVIARAGRYYRGHSDRYTAYSDGRTLYDREFGFSYVPQRKIHGVRVENGMPVLSYQRYSNALGNIGELKDGYREADLKILIFGDSFTAMQENDVVWPKLLESHLTERLSKNVNVLNFSRDGYGILQMFDLAAAKVGELRPDLVIIAFISDDMNRRRIWRFEKAIGGVRRFFVSDDPAAQVEKAVDFELVNSNITEDWCRQMVEAPKADDPLLVGLERQNRDIQQEYEVAIAYDSVSQSYLYDRIVHRNPFFGFTVENRPIMKLTYRDFREDLQFVGKIRALNRSQTPYYLIQLPVYEEMLAGKHLPTSQETALIRSLEQLTERSVLQLAPSVGTYRGDLKDLFLLPHDHHPSAKGLEFYAKVVADLLHERGFV